MDGIVVAIVIICDLLLAVYFSGVVIAHIYLTVLSWRERVSLFLLLWLALRWPAMLWRYFRRA